MSAPSLVTASCKSVFLAFLAMGSLFIAPLAHAAPGGVSANLELWFKAGTNTYNTGTTEATDGQSVETWIDQSGSGNNATTVSKDPTFRGPNSSEALNFYPVVDFDTSAPNALDLPEFPTPGSVQVFAVTSGNGGNGMVFGTARFASDYWLLLQEPTSNNIAFQVGDTGNGIIQNFVIGKNETGIMYEVKHFGGTSSVRANAGAFTTKTGVTSVNAVNQMSLGSRSNGNSTYYDGKISELIFYNAEKTGTDVAKIHSYLLLKYGVNPDQTTPQNLLDSSGNVIWDGVTDSTYNSNIIGIGRDDAQPLGVVQTRSVADDAILLLQAEGEGTNTANTFTDIVDQEFLLTGSNGGGSTWVTCGAGAPAGYNALARVWNVQEQGEVGTVSLDFDVADADFDVQALLNGTSYYFLYDSNNDDSLLDETPVAMTNTSGDIWQITGVNLDDGMEFTLATENPTTIQFSTTSASDDENVGGNLPTFYICGSVSTASTITVTDLGTGTASSGTDYTPPQATAITIPTGSYDGTAITEVAIPNLAITGDVDVEPDETINLTLGSPTGDLNLGTNTAHTYTIDNDEAFGVTINQDGGQSDPTNVGTVTFTAVFNQAINTGTFTTADIDTSSSTATGITVNSVAEVAPNDGTTFAVSVTATGDGDIIATIPASSVQTPGADNNTVSTSTDNSITLNTQGPADITRQNPLTLVATLTSVTFRVTFGEDMLNVDTTDFQIKSGASTGTISTVTPVSASVYDVDVTSIAIAGDTTLTLEFASGQNITNVAAGGAFPGTTNTNEHYEIDDLGASTTAIEDAGFNSGDGDGDGTPDRLDQATATIVDTVTGGSTTLVAGGVGCTTINAFTIDAESSLTATDASNTYPIGLYNYTIDCTTGGGGSIAQIEIYLDELRTDDDNWDFVKFDGATFTPLTDFTPVTALNLLVEDFTIPNGPETGTQITKISYQIQDGDVFDQDGTANGVIVDPIGPALPQAASSTGGGGETVCKKLLVDDFLYDSATQQVAFTMGPLQHGSNWVLREISDLLGEYFTLHFGGTLIESALINIGINSAGMVSVTSPLAFPMSEDNTLVIWTKNELSQNNTCDNTTTYTLTDAGELMKSAAPSCSTVEYKRSSEMRGEGVDETLFADTSRAHRAYLPLIDLAEQEIVGGDGDTGFARLDDSINRAEVAKIFTIGREDTVQEGPCGEEIAFGDIGENDWFLGFVQNMQKNNIIHGYDDGLYRPGQTINKAELLKIAAIAFDFITKDEADMLIYGTSQKWYEPYEAVLDSHNILPVWMKDIPASVLMTRGDVFAVLANILTFIDGR